MASPLFDLTGKVAVVTGSSKGIGKAIALHLALSGAKVVVSSRKAPVCEEAAAEIRKAGGNATVIPFNISDKTQVERLIAETKKQLGPVDILVCNAASNPYYGPNEKLPDDVFMKVMQNNILSNMWLINNCLPDMRAKKDGSIMIVSSIGGVRASTVIGAYCISKAADMQLARNLAAEYGARQYPREHHRARPHHDRLCARFVRGSAEACGARGEHAAPASRRARRHRRHRRPAGGQGWRLYHGPDHYRRWRHDDWLNHEPLPGPEADLSAQPRSAHAGAISRRTRRGAGGVRTQRRGEAGTIAARHRPALCAGRQRPAPDALRGAAQDRMDGLSRAHAPGAQDPWRGARRRLCFDRLRRCRHARYPP